MDLINGWSDKGMNWENPQPEKVVYFQALYQALTQRYKATNLQTPRQLQQQPDTNNICTIQHINILTNIFRQLLGLHFYIDGDYKDYVGEIKNLTPERPFFYQTDMPKKMDYSNFADLPSGSPYILSENATREEIAALMKILKECICRLRYTPYNLYGLTKEYYFQAQEHDPPTVKEAIDGAFEEIDGRSPFFYLLGHNYSFIQNRRIGAQTIHYKENEDGYCGYVYTYACELETFFPKDFFPYIYVLAYAKKMAETGKIQGSNDQVSQSIFKSGSLNLVQGFNKILLEDKRQANYKCSFGTPYQGKWYPATPKSDFPENGEIIRRKCCIGCMFTYTFILDWAVEGGFKFR